MGTLGAAVRAEARGRPQLLAQVKSRAEARNLGLWSSPGLKTGTHERGVRARGRRSHRQALSPKPLSRKPTIAKRSHRPQPMICFAIVCSCMFDVPS